MKLKFYATTLLAGITIWALAFQPSNDSTETIHKQKKNSPQVILRVHTMGLFTYSGKVINSNPATDVYVNYTSLKGWGLAAFKIVDLNDVHSNNNFTFVLLSKSFYVTERLTLTPFIGTVLEQQYNFAGKGSDVLAMFTTSFRLNKNWVIDHNAMFSNLIFEKSAADWTNRFRAMYSTGHLDATASFWNNNKVIDQTSYTSVGASIFYNRVPIANRLWLGVGITGIIATNSSNPELVPHKNGIQFTTALTIK